MAAVASALTFSVFTDNFQIEKQKRCPENHTALHLVAGESANAHYKPTDLVHIGHQKEATKSTNTTFLDIFLGTDLEVCKQPLSLLMIQKCSGHFFHLCSEHLITTFFHNFLNHFARGIFGFACT